MAKKVLPKHQTKGVVNKETGLYKKPTAFQTYLATTKGAVGTDTIPKTSPGSNMASFTAANPKNNKKLGKAIKETLNLKKTGGSVKSKKK